MRVFIAGATGVLGQALIPQLLEHGHSVRAQVRSPEKAEALKSEKDLIEIVSGDLLSPETAKQLPQMIEGCDAVMHIVTAIPRNPSAAGAWDANTRLRTEGTRTLLDAALAAHVHYYFQQSIVMAYINGGDAWLDESTPLDTSAARAAICKPVIRMEEMVRAIPVEKMPWCILRGGLFVGSGTGQDETVARIREGKIVVPCDGSNFISPVNVSDMAHAFVLALTNALPGSTFNIVAEPVRNGEYLDHIASLLHVSPPPRNPSEPCPPSHRCSNEAARTFLGWKPEHSIYEGIS
jgi:nucleoside-diphosphate-sugar epimerase